MKKILAILLTVVCVFGFAACGGSTGASGDGGDTKDANAWPRELDGDYLFEDGKYQCQTFMIDVPEGWVLHESGCNDHRVTLYRAASDDEYAYNQDAKLEISVDDYTLMSGDFYVMDNRVQNDTQFYVGDTPAAVEDATVAEYTGKKLSGVSGSYKDCNIEHYDLEKVIAGTSNGSLMDIDTYAYDDEQKADIDSIINSLTVLLVEPGSEEGEGSEDAAAGGTYTMGADGKIEITLPEGWYPEGEPTASSLKVKNDKFMNGYVQIYVNTNSPTAAESSEKVMGNYAGKTFDTVTEEYNGITYVGFDPNDTQGLRFADIDEGRIIKISTMFLSIEQCADLMNAITMK